jgi:hypothetical protein
VLCGTKTWRRREGPLSRLCVTLSPGSVDASSENPSGPATFVRESEEPSGALQISLQGEYVRGPLPNPSPDQLIRFAEGIATKEPGAELRGRSSGECALGTYGTVLARITGCAWMQAWVMTNGRDFVLATHTSIDEPTESEVNDVSVTRGGRGSRAAHFRQR